MDFSKMIKVNYTMSGSLSSWNEPVGIALRENICNVLEELIDQDCIELGERQEELKKQILKQV